MTDPGLVDAFALAARASKPGGAPAAGARTSISPTGAPEVAAVSGLAFAACRPGRSSGLSPDAAAAARLGEVSEPLTGRRRAPTT